MASIQQLYTVIKVEKRKEDALLRQYQEAKQYVFAHQQKLTGLEQYKVEYLKLIHQKTRDGIDAKTLIQHQNFLAKLDKACHQQIQVINQGVMVEQQRKRQWITQQQKTNAVKTLLEKQTKQQQILESQREQKQFDEIACQQFIRAKSYY